MKTYTVILSITTKFGDPNTWDWTTLLDGEQVRVEHTHSNPPARKHQSRDAERTAIYNLLKSGQPPMTTRAIAIRAGFDPVLAARLVFELKGKRKLREAGRDDSGNMMYEVV